MPEARFAPGALDPSSDEAVVGFAALAALGLLVDCAESGVAALAALGLAPSGRCWCGRKALLNSFSVLV